MNRLEIIGQNIKKYREHFGVRQEELAELLKISRVQISHFESAKRKIPLSNLEKISDYLGIELLDLMEDNPDNVNLNVAMSFRRNAVKEEDDRVLGEFRLLAKNYLKILRIEKTNG